MSREAMQQEPIGFMSPKQAHLIKDPDDESGHYIPMRKTPAGLFTLALYTAPQPQPQPLFGELIAQHPGLAEELAACGEMPPEWFEGMPDEYRLAAWRIKNEPAQEPAAAPHAKMTEEIDLVLSDSDTKLSAGAVRALRWLRTWVSVPLYTAPPQPPTVFDDQARFMTACGQTVGQENREQFALYQDLITEEVMELADAMTDTDRFDALLDIIVVCIGAGHSLGFPMAAGWDAVHLSNLRKVDPATGQVLRRADGKILKPEGWRPPNLARLLETER